MALSEEDKQYYHNKGEKDGAENRYDKPVDGFMDALFGRDPEANDYYDKGRENARNQR